MPARRDDSFIDELMDTSLYSMGAYFTDQHPELVDEVIAQSEAIEDIGLRGYADQNGLPLEECFNTLLTVPAAFIFGRVYLVQSMVVGRLASSTLFQSASVTVSMRSSGVVTARVWSPASACIVIQRSMSGVGKWKPGGSTPTIV